MLTAITPTSFAMEEKELVTTVGDREEEFVVGDTVADVRAFWGLPPIAGVLRDSTGKSVQTIIAGGGPYVLHIHPSVFPQGTQ